MSSAPISSVIKTIIKAHTPLIKFPQRTHALLKYIPSITNTSGAITNVTANKRHEINLEELPEKYWRQVMSQEEMDYINRGGPA